MHKNKGAVSIFLIIILLPSLTCAGIFLDMARTKFAHEVAISSADLALNTVLTDYDQELKDYFGLLASAQDTSSIIEVSKQYFADSMVSAGVATSDAQMYADEVFGAFGGNSDIQDFLKISVVNGETNINKIPNGAMDNPALLKTGLIEFMKYRAPVNAAADLFSKLMDSEVEKQMENVSMETKMIEARDKFYQAERKLIEQAEIAYDAIKDYQNFQTHTGELISSENFIEQMAVFMANPEGEGSGSIEEIFKAAHTTMVMNLYNTHSTTGTNAVSLLSAKSIPRQNKSTTFSDSAKASGNRIADLLKVMNSTYETYCSKRAALDAAWSNMGSKKSTDWPVQYWVKLSDTCKDEYGSYVTAAANLWSAANRVANAVEFAGEDAMTEVMARPSNNYIRFAEADPTGQITVQAAYDALWNSYCNNYKSEIEGQSGCRSFRNINTTLASLDTSYNRSLLDVGQLNPVFRIRNKVDKYISDAEEGAKKAHKAGEETEKLLDLIDRYKAAFSNWKTIAFDGQLDDSDLATKEASKPMEGGDRQQIEELERNGLDYFSKNSVKDLRTRMINIYKMWRDFSDDLKDIKYKNTSIRKISEYVKFRSAASLDPSRIVLDEGALRQYADESFSFKIGQEIQRIIIPKYSQTSAELKNGDSYVITDSFYPDIEHTRMELYIWMKEKFDNKSTNVKTTTAAQTGFDVNDKGSAKDADKEVERKSEDVSSVDTSENTTGHSFSEWSGSALPSGGAYQTPPQDLTAKISEVSSFTSSIFSDFSGTFKRSVASARDDLYTLSYVFDMFTWDTFEKELSYNALSEDDKNSNDPESKYQAPKADDLETLTLTPRNTKNNWAYGGEVEYILYGGSDNAKNKSSAYARIYMARYALDLSPVFQFYWDDKVLSSVAAALEGFAHIPQGVTKTVACLAITAAEAGVDVKYLKQGRPVLLYKSEDKDLVCNYQSVFSSKDTNNRNNLKGRVALQYSDYLKIFLMAKMIGNDENTIYLRVGDIIQANMALSTGNSGFALSKSQVFYSLDSRIRIEPMWSRLLLIDDLGDLSEATGWRTTTINITSGY